MLVPDEPMGFEYYYLYTSGDNTSITPDNFASHEGETVGVTAGTMQIEFLRQWCEKKDVHLRFVEYADIPVKEADLLAGMDGHLANPLKIAEFLAELQRFS